MYAIVKSGGRQYRAEVGHSFQVEKLPYEVGDKFELDEVLLVANDENITIGQPLVSGVSVTATVTEQLKGKKIFVWKYRPSKRYRRRQGHRQQYTRIRIDSINLSGSVDNGDGAGADFEADAAGVEADAAAGAEA